MSRFLAVLLHGHIPYHIGTCQRADDCYCRPLRFILGRFHEVIQLFMPPGTLVPGWPYALLLFLSFFIFFNAISPRSVGRSPRNFATRSEACSIYKCRSRNSGVCPPKKLGGEKHAKFGAISGIFPIWARISPKRVEISKIWKMVHFSFPRSTNKGRWTLVH